MFPKKRKICKKKAKTGIIGMEQLAIRKNTLPYIQPYSVIDEDTGGIWGHYKTFQMAMIALRAFNSAIAAVYSQSFL